MNSSWIKRGRLLLALVFLGAAFGCIGTPNPAAPPAPPAELPSALRFPSTLAIDVDRLGEAGQTALTAQAALSNQVLPIGGEFFEAILLGFNINRGANIALDAILEALNALEIPLNPVTRTFEITNPPGVSLGVKIKIDFADYDFDGTGITKGCTGCTCPTGCDAACPTEAPEEDLRPVCFRIWTDPDGSGTFRRFIAGFFDRLSVEDDPATQENEQNPGAGSFRIRFEEGAFDGNPPILVTNVGSNYNHRVPQKPLDKVTEYFLGIFSPVFGPPNATNSFVKVEQEALEGATSEDQLLKTIRESVNQEDFDDPDFESTFQYIARFREDADFWSGTFQNDLIFPGVSFADPPPGVEDFTAECAQLSTAIGVDEGTCEDLGIDVTNVPFLDLLGSADPRVNLPADFPALPTF